MSYTTIRSIMVLIIAFIGLIQCILEIARVPKKILRITRGISLTLYIVLVLTTIIITNL